MNDLQSIKQILSTFKYTDQPNVSISPPESYPGSVSFAINNGKVYVGGNEVSGADPNTFTKLGNDYFKDANHVYYEFYVVPNPDPGTFTSVGIGYGKDASHVYYNTSIMQGADPATITPVAHWSLYMKDSKHIYYGGEVLQGADPQTFTDLGNGGYTKDAIYVYWQGRIIPGADPIPSFQPVTVMPRIRRKSTMKLMPSPNDAC